MGRLSESSGFNEGKRKYLSSSRRSRRNAQKYKRARLEISPQPISDVEPNTVEESGYFTNILQSTFQLEPDEQQVLTKFDSIDLPTTSQSQPSEERVSTNLDQKLPLLEGRRLVDIRYLLDQIAEISKHPPFDCTFADMEVISEQCFGLQSRIKFRCKMCQIVKCIGLVQEEKEPDVLAPNNALSLASISTGTGYSTIEEIFASLNIPFMSPSTYQRHYEKVAETIAFSAWEIMIEAGKEEADMARSIGQIDDKGIPLIAVIADGAWSKRSYGVNYDAASGVACIIGARTRKILFLGVRNKYCCVCDRNSTISETKQHKCYKNWSGTSTSMETDIIVDGFKTSMEMHGVKYYRLIGDGDSSVYKKLLEIRPYGNMIIEKVECRNHLLRNFSKKIRGICDRKRSDSKNLPVLPTLRKIVQSNERRLRTAIRCAISHRIGENISFQEKVKNLGGDLKNIASHVFGEHKSCKNIGYFKCSPKEEEINYVPQMRNCGLMEDIEVAFYRLISNSNSLVTNMDTNTAEQYNSVICKFVGGKRINFSLKGSYETRCKAAAISFNSKGDFLGVMGKHRLPFYTTRYVNKIKKKKIRQRTTTARKAPKKRMPADKDYGPEASNDPDMTDEVYQQQKIEFLNKLSKSKEEIAEIERNTRGQAHNPNWQQERAIRITASNFGDICKMRKKTSCVNKIKKLLYEPFKGNNSTKYGNEHEPLAKQQFEDEYNIKVEDTGIFIYFNDSSLAASPDGMTGDGGLIEVKCPAKCAKMHPKEAIEQKQLQYCSLDENDQLKLKRNHNYFYQIQGQLNICNREFCYFVVWSPLGLMVEKIERDKDFWEQEMLPKLNSFYNICLLPELIDPRFTRGLTIRNPSRDY